MVCSSMAMALTTASTRHPGSFLSILVCHHSPSPLLGTPELSWLFFNSSACLSRDSRIIPQEKKYPNKQHACDVYVKLVSTLTRMTFGGSTGNTYRLRISNVGLKSTLNFRIENHRMLLVETEGSYTRQQLFDSLDVHVGQSYSVLVTADQVSKDYYVMASPRFENTTTFYQFAGVGIMHYSTSPGPASGPHPIGPDPDDIWFSLDQERSIK